MRQEWQDKLDVLTGSKTQAQIDQANQLASTTDATTQSLMRQVFAQQDLATTAAASAKGVSTAFAILQKSVADEKSALAKTYDASVKTTQTAIDALGTSVSKLSSLSSSLKSTLNGMTPLGTEGIARADAQAQIMTALALARAGGVMPDADTLSNALGVVAKPSEALFANFVDYQRDFIKTKNDISDLSDIAGDQLSDAQRQLTALQDQLTVLKAGFDAENARLDGILTTAQSQIDAANGTTVAVMSVEAAIANLAAALNVSAAASATPAPLAYAAAIDSGKATSDQIAAASSGTLNPSSVYAQVVAKAGVSYGNTLGTVTELYEAAHKLNIPGFANGVNAGILPADTVLQAHGGEQITPAVYVDKERVARDETNALLKRLVAANDSMKDDLKQTRAELTLIKGTNKDIRDVTLKSDAIGPAPARAAA
jgi:hypothetical protein